MAMQLDWAVATLPRGAVAAGGRSAPFRARDEAAWMWIQTDISKAESPHATQTGSVSRVCSMPAAAGPAGAIAGPREVGGMPGIGMVPGIGT